MNYHFTREQWPKFPGQEWVENVYVHKRIHQFNYALGLTNMNSKVGVFIFNIYNTTKDDIRLSGAIILDIYKRKIGISLLNSKDYSAYNDADKKSLGTMSVLIASKNIEEGKNDIFNNPEDIDKACSLFGKDTKSKMLMSFAFMLKEWNESSYKHFVSFSDFIRERTVNPNVYLHYLNSIRNKTISITDPFGK